ncbi:diguanylate cyclase domain-containing protein [Leptothrix discophora]|uniref:Diguanylate cyclase n=1 Tax=Leptothrix discophora TaxID=89 RepID=A0ABT9G948_LEPDI|nr:diguanylate cyclase [Leptothrix discophora]MDP4302998.1 diguanylate cyclase [Leptothrix discophora]
MYRLLSLEELDTACVAQWRQGVVERCRHAAGLLRSRAIDAGDLLHEARAELHLAMCAQREAQYVLALTHARRACALARHERDMALEIEALSIQGAAAAVSGQDQLSEEAGQLARRLARQLADPIVTLQVCDSLGVAQAWLGHVEAARQSLAQGTCLASDAGRVDWACHLLIHAAFAEALMLARSWDLSQGLPSLARRRQVEVAMQAALARCEVTPGVMAAGTQRSGRFLLAWVDFMLAVWRGEPDDAEADLQRLQALLPHERAWMGGLARWAQVVHALVLRDNAKAESQARLLIAAAHDMGHQPLLEQGRRAWLLAQSRLGRLNPMELGALRLMPSPAAEATSSCTEDMLAFELRLRELGQREAAQLPAWRREDSLTGLASREHFQAQTDELLQRTDPTRAQVSVLVLALDPGQVLAAHHSPLVRDRVLCTLAALIRQVLRAGDLPARWSHDELVALLHRASGEDVARVCERVHLAVREHDWSAIAPGLDVRVCLGHASARVGDTLDGLMRRCESSRFASLRREYRKVAHAA